MQRVSDKKRSRKRKVLSAADLFTPFVPKAVSTLDALLDSSNDNVRLGAAKEVFDRVYGKAKQPLDVAASVAVTREELDAAAKAALLAAGVRG